MIKQSDIITDMHTHTTFSLHAYSTIKENLEVAKQRNLKYLCISDHYYHNCDDIVQKNETTRIAYMESTINPYLSNIEIIGSAEFNLNQEIHSWDKLKNLRWRPIGLHSWFIDIPNTTLDELYHLFEISCDKHNCFVHIERELHKIEQGKYATTSFGNKNEINNDIKLWLEAICILAKEKDIYLEVNESSLVSNEGNASDRLKYWVKFAKENGNKISLGSDAHYCNRVGDFTNVIKVLNEIDYPKELILNCNENMIKELKGLN